MKKVVLGLVMAAVMGVGSAGAAPIDKVAVGDLLKFGNPPSPLTRYGNGGPFEATNTSQANYKWVTFCLEVNEYLDIAGNTFEVAGISDRAKQGGAGGRVGTSPNAYDPLDPRTAYLYTQFRNGVAGFTNGADIQAAIWVIENEILLTSVTDAARQARVGSLITAATDAGWTGIGNVRVVNLKQVGTQYPGYPDGQDQLMMVPEPASMLLLGAGLLGLAGRMRRRAH